MTLAKLSYNRTRVHEEREPKLASESLPHDGHALRSRGSRPSQLVDFHPPPHPRHSRQGSKPPTASSTSPCRLSSRDACILADQPWWLRVGRSIVASRFKRSMHAAREDRRPMASTMLPAYAKTRPRKGAMIGARKARRINNLRASTTRRYLPGRQMCSSTRRPTRTH